MAGIGNQLHPEVRMAIPMQKLTSTQLLALMSLSNDKEPFFLHQRKVKDVDGAASYIEPTPPLTPTSEDQDKDQQPSLETVLGYIDPVVEKLQKSEYGDIEAARELLKFLIGYAEQNVLSGKDIHTFVLSSPIKDSRKSKLLRSYYDALHTSNVIPRPPKNGLFGTLTKSLNASSKPLYTIFGGQGLRTNYVQELAEITAAYNPLVEDLINDSAALLNKLSNTSRDVREIFSESFNILAWLQDSANIPGPGYLSSAPFSAPLVGLIQLAHYEVTCKILGLTPGEFCKQIAGTTGHSQGIITAVVVATGKDWSSWREITRTTITMLFWIGVRTQQVWNTSSSNSAISHAMSQDCIDHSEGTPSPMLSVRGLARETLQEYVDAANRYLKQSSRILSINMTNGPRQFVISGPPKYLYGLALQIRKAKRLETRGNYEEEDSKEKAVGSRFLEVSVPFHSVWLEDAVPFIQDDLKGILLRPSAMAVPVFGSEDGREICRLSNTDDELDLLDTLIMSVV
ncbi:hypothetical protein ACHAQF_008409, partial [Verticillium nonalfalfae]